MRVDGSNSYYCGFGVQTSEGERARSVMWLDTDSALYYQAAEPFHVHRSGDIAGALFQVDRIEVDGGRNVFVLHGEHRRVQAGDLEYASWFPIAPNGQRVDGQPAAAPAPCVPGRHCERYARGLGACVAGHCNPPAPEVADAVRQSQGPTVETLNQEEIAQVRAFVDRQRESGAAFVPSFGVMAAPVPVRLHEGKPRDFGQAQDRYGEHLDRPSGVNPVEAPSKPITSLAEFCAEGERLGLTAADLVEPLSKRPEFADCLPGADGVPEAPAPVRLHEGRPRDFGQAQDRYGEHLDRPPGLEAIGNLARKRVTPFRKEVVYGSTPSRDANQVLRAGVDPATDPPTVYVHATGVLAPPARSCTTCANHGDGKRIPGVIGTPCDNCAPPPRLSNWTPLGVPVNGGKR